MTRVLPKHKVSHDNKEKYELVKTHGLTLQGSYQRTEFNMVREWYLKRERIRG